MDCERLNSPVLSFVDINGKPLVGGKLYTYEAGTSTLATTYRDIDGTEANENPILLDGRGECVCFLDCEKTYKIVLKDAHDCTIWEQDNVLPNNISGLQLDIATNNQRITDLENRKVDKVNGASAGNFAALTQEGGIGDSGVGPEDFAPAGIVDVAVRTDIEQNFDDEKQKQGRDNIKAQKYVGGPGSFIDDSAVYQDNLWASVGELDLEKLGIFGYYYNCFVNISLSLEVTVYNTGSADSEIVEHGRFNINVHAEPSNGKWIVDAGWAEYKGRGNTRLVELMRVSRNNNASGIGKLTLHVKVPQPSTFYANALNVSVLNNYGSIHKNDALNSTRAFVAPWTLYLGGVWENLLGKHENISPINYYIASRYDSYVDYSTFSGTKLELLDTPNYTQTDGDNAVKRGDLPIIVDQRFGEGATAFPIAITDSAQKFVSINTVRRMSVFNGGPSGNIEYRARLSSTGFMTPEIDTTTAGIYLVGEDYLYPTAGQTHSISVYFEVVDPDSSVYNVMATWRRSGTDDPKEFKIAVTYFGNTVGCWHGTKTLSTTETDLVVTDFENMVKIEIDFISTDGERWYHFEYIKEANRSRMVEY